jgi:ribose transport system substrate-binding protein
MWATPLIDAFGASIANPTPVQFGELQDSQVDISRDLKELIGQNQFPVAVAVGKGKVAIFAGNQNALNLQARVKGVREAAKKYPGITIVDAFYHAETPQDAAAEVLRVKNAYPDISGYAMIGGWPLFTRTLLTDLDPKKVKIVAIDALPAQLPYIESGLAPVLFAQPVFSWGYVSVKTIFDHVYKKQPVGEKVQMDLVKVSKDNLGAWAKQLKEWGFSDVDPKYLALPK